MLFAAGITVALGLDNWAGNTENFEISKLTIFGIFIAYIYSAPPLKLKVRVLLFSFVNLIALILRKQRTRKSINITYFTTFFLLFFDANFRTLYPRLPDGPALLPLGAPTFPCLGCVVR